MKKLTFMLLAAFIAVTAYAQSPNLTKQAIAAKPIPVKGISNEMMKKSLAGPAAKDVKASRRAQEDFPIITEQPEGELKYYKRSGSCYYYSNKQVYQTTQSGTVNIVFAKDNNKVYIQDPISKFDAGTWVEGDINEEGTTITVPLFQNLLYNSSYDACLMTAVSKRDGDSWVINDEVTEVTYTINGAEISLNNTNEDELLGAFWTDDFSWQGYGDWESVYTDISEMASTNPVNLPDGVETEVMPLNGMFFEGLGGGDGVEINSTVEVGFDNNDVYIKGLVTMLPDAWMKGTLSAEGEVTFDVQYIGDIDEQNYWIAGYGGSSELVSFTMTYDADFNTMEADGLLLVSPDPFTLSSSNYGYFSGLFIGTPPPTITPPDDIEPVKMAYTGQIYDGDTHTIANVVNVIIDNKDVYIQGLVQEVPDGWIKGTIDESGTLVTFEMGQYVGKNASSSGSIFLVGEDEDGEPSDTYFSYDAESNKFVLQNYTFSSGKKDQIYYWSALFPGLTIGADAKWVAAEQGYANEEVVTAFQFDSVSATADKANGNSDPIYDETNTALKLVANNTLTISSDKEIAAIVISMTGNARQMKLSADKGEYELVDNVGVWTGDENEVVFTVPSGMMAQQALIQRIDIFYVDTTTTPVTVPEDLYVEEYHFEGFNTYSEEDLTKSVFVGFTDNNVVYIQGLSDYLPEAWVKGYLEEGTLTIPERYLGVYETEYGDYDMFFNGATFAYDPEGNQFTSEEGFTTTLILDDEPMTWDEYSNVIITLIPDVAATPAQPDFDQVALDDSTYGPYVILYIPTFDTEDNPILSSKLTYQLSVSINDEVSPLPIVGNYSEIPFTYTDDNYISDYYGDRAVLLSNDADEIALWDKIGVQSFYYGGGETNESEITWYTLKEEVATGIENVGAAETATYTDLMGRKATKATKGLVIKTVKKADGTVKSIKMVRK